MSHHRPADSASHDAIALVTDLIFATRIRSTAQRLGGSCRFASSLDQLESSLGDHAPAVVLIDMNAGGVDPVEAIRTVRTMAAECRVVAFLSHVQRELAEAAREAGAHEVVPRSVFVQRLEEWLGGRVSH